MSRALLTLCLSLFATAALAGNPAVTDETAPTCPKTGKTGMTNNAQDSDGTLSGRTGNTGGSHGRGSSVKAASPRWHSLLPGMFR